MQRPLFLVADVGGTNTRVALARGGDVDPGSVRRYANRGHANLAPVLARYRADTGCPAPDGACVAIAGPVADGVGALTNLDWSIDTASLCEAAGARAGSILNDLQAQGHALGHVAADRVRTVIAGSPRADATRLVVNVGTGFNSAAVHVTATGRFVPPAETGHGTLPVRSDADLRLATFVSAAHGFPAVEDVLSGRGLERVYRWHASEAGSDDTRTAAEIATDAGDDPRADAALTVFLRMMGTVAGDLALNHLPFGGLYLVGGVARAMAGRLGDGTFESAFLDKGRFAAFMRAFPVSLVEDDYAALTGCAAHLAERAA